MRRRCDLPKRRKTASIQLYTKGTQEDQPRRECNFAEGISFRSHCRSKEGILISLQSTIDTGPRHFTVLGFTAATGEPILCVIIFTGEGLISPIARRPSRKEAGRKSRVSFVTKPPRRRRKNEVVRTRNASACVCCMERDEGEQKRFFNIKFHQGNSLQIVPCKITSAHLD
jgi:hypothetical protein